MAYLDNTVDDATTYKGKLDESVTLVREPPASTTTTGGTAGVDYDVADWPSTLVSGRTYWADIHATNIARAVIEGNAVLRPDGNGTEPLDLQPGPTPFYFDGSNLFLTVLPRYPTKTMSGTSGTTFTRIFRYRTTGSFEDQYVKMLFVDEGGGINGSLVVDFYIRIDDISVPQNPGAVIRVSDIQDGMTPNLVSHDSFFAYFHTVTTSEIIVDFYFGGNASLLNYQPLHLFSDNIDNHLTFFEGDGTDTEANITGGTFDVVSRPAEGELEKQQYRASNLDAAGEVTRLCRVTLPNASTTDSIGFRLLLHDVTRNAVTPQDDWEAVIACRQNAVFGSAPEVSIATRALTQAIGLTHSKLHAHVVDNTGPTIIDFYIEHHNASTDWVFRVDDIALGDTDARIELFDSDGVTTEATVTGGSWDVSSQAARGEIVTGSFTTASIAQNDYNGFNTIAHNLGTDNVDVDALIAGSTNDFWDGIVRRPDGKGKKIVGPALAQVNNFALGDPSSGEVLVAVRNDSASTQTFDVMYKITAL